MTNDVSTLASSGLANISGMTSALSNLAQSAASGGSSFNGRELLKLDKGMGVWVYGQEGAALDEAIVVNPESFMHGLIAWGESVVLGEHMVPISQPAPDPTSMPNVGKAYSVQLSFEAAIPGLNTQLIYKTTALGGKEFIGKLAQTIVGQLTDAPEFPVPLIKLDSSHYQHKSWGRIFKPEFKVVNWRGVSDTTLPEEAEPAPAPEPEKPKRRRTRNK